MRARAVWLAALLVAGCGPSPAEKAASDARAVAQVEAAQKMKPPVVPIALDVIPADEIATAGLANTGCRFGSEAGRDEPTAVLGKAKGVIRVGGKIIVIAADSGSAALAPSAYEQYASRTHSLQVTRGPGEGEAGTGGRRWQGSLTIRDAYERVVSFTPGWLLCGA